MGRYRDSLATAARYFSSIHRPVGRPNACIVSAPRSGSTWLLELILSQPGFKPCNEPFNLRKGSVVRRLGLDRWEQLNDAAYLPQMQAYLETFLENRYSAAFKGLRPGLAYHRFITRRIAFKILFGFEHRMDWLQETLNARTVVLIRHPIPVALSRQELPRLKSFLDSEFRDSLTADQIRIAEEVIGTQDFQKMAVLDWCMQYAVPLQRFRGQFLLLTYEQLVMRPRPALQALVEHLDLDDVDVMSSMIDRPSASVSKSGAETVSFLKSGGADDDKQWLVDKWRPKIAVERERELMQLVKDFGIDVYSSGESVPAAPYWL